MILFIETVQASTNVLSKARFALNESVERFQ